MQLASTTGRCKLSIITDIPQPTPAMHSSLAPSRLADQALPDVQAGYRMLCSSATQWPVRHRSAA